MSDTTTMPDDTSTTEAPPMEPPPECPLDDLLLVNQNISRLVGGLLNVTNPAQLQDQLDQITALVQHPTLQNCFGLYNYVTIWGEGTYSEDTTECPYDCSACAVDPGFADDSGNEDFRRLMEKKASRRSRNRRSRRMQEDDDSEDDDSEDGSEDGSDDASMDPVELDPADVNPAEVDLSTSICDPHCVDDPCCVVNSTSCCLPRPLQYTSTEPIGVNRGVIIDKCGLEKLPDVEALTMAAADAVLSLIRGGSKKCTAGGGAASQSALVNSVNKKVQQCYNVLSTGFGSKTDSRNQPQRCKSSVECYSKTVNGEKTFPACVGKDGSNVCAYDDMDAFVPDCLVQSFSPETVGYLKAALGLAGNAPMPVFQEAFTQAVSIQTCVGPSAITYPDWDTCVDQLDSDPNACDPAVASTQAACLQNQVCNWQDPAGDELSAAECLAGPLDGGGNPLYRQNTSYCSLNGLDVGIGTDGAEKYRTQSGCMGICSAGATFSKDDCADMAFCTGDCFVNGTLLFACQVAFQVDYSCTARYGQLIAALSADADPSTNTSAGICAGDNYDSPECDEAYFGLLAQQDSCFLGGNLHSADLCTQVGQCFLQDGTMSYATRDDCLANTTCANNPGYSTDMCSDCGLDQVPINEFVPNVVITNDWLNTTWVQRAMVSENQWQMGISLDKLNDLIYKAIAMMQAPQFASQAMCLLNPVVDGIAKALCTCNSTGYQVCDGILNNPVPVAQASILAGFSKSINAPGVGSIDVNSLPGSTNAQLVVSVAAAETARNTDVISEAKAASNRIDIGGRQRRLGRDIVIDRWGRRLQTGAPAGLARSSCGYDIIVNASNVNVAQIASDATGLTMTGAQANVTLCIERNTKIPLDPCRFCDAVPVFAIQRPDAVRLLPGTPVPSGTKYCMQVRPSGQTDLFFLGFGGNTSCPAPFGNRTDSRCAKCVANNVVTASQELYSITTTSTTASSTAPSTTTASGSTRAPTPAPSPAPTTPAPTTSGGASSAATSTAPTTAGSTSRAGTTVTVGLTTQAATTATTKAGSTVLEGSMKMTVANVQVFISDPQVSAAVGKGIAEAIKVDHTWVAVKLSAGRRLAAQTEGNMRRLQGGTVVAAYTITVPPGATVTPAAIQSTLAKSDAAAVLTADINKQMEKAGLTGPDFTVAVTQITAPTLPSTTTTTPAKEKQTSGGRSRVALPVAVQHSLALAVLLFATSRQA